MPSRNPAPARGPGPVRRYLAGLRASEAYLAHGVRHTRWLDLGQFRWHDIELARSVRAALGVLAPLAIGLATGHSAYGSFAALGALPAGFVSFRGVTRTRVLAVGAAAAGMAISTFAGATSAYGLPWLLVPEVIIWAYLVGLIAALGTGAGVVAMQWAVALLIGSALPLSPGHAAVRAGLVLAGGLWQGTLVVLSWLLTRGSTERAALAASCQALSRYAAELGDGKPGPPPPVMLPGTKALTDPNPLLRTDDRLQLTDLLEEAERIRSTLAALGPAAPADTGPSARGLAGLLARAAHVLGDIALALTGRPAERAGALGRARQRLDHAPQLSDTRSRWAAEALAGQLRAAIRIAERLSDAEPDSARLGWRGGDADLGRAGQRAALLTLRASLGPSSEAGLDAIRLAAVAGATEALVLAARLGHGYWGVITVFIVLKPDYGSTLQRGLQRAAGTIAGAWLGVATAELARAGSAAMLAGIGVSLIVAYAVFTVNYLLYAVFLTDFLVVLLALLGLPAEQTALARLSWTGIGVAVAVAGYLLWPTWEGPAASEKFAWLLESQGRYANALLRAYSRPASADPARLRSLQLAARRARGDAEASADRLADEPAWPPMTPPLATALTSAVRRFAQAALTLDAAVAARRKREAAEPDPVQPALDRLGDGLALTTSGLARSLRSLRPPEDLPRLRELHNGVAAERGASAALLGATDGLVDSANTAADVLARQLGPGRPDRGPDNGPDDGPDRRPDGTR